MGSTGLGDTETRSTPCLIEKLEPYHIRYVCAGSFHGYAVTDDKLFGFGSRKYLGIGNVDGCSVDPVEINIGQPIVKIEANQHTLALTKYGQVYVWGPNGYGECGIDDAGDFIYTPRLLDMPSRVRDIAVGVEHSVICTYDGECYFMGYNENQMGIKPNSEIRTPTRMDNLRDYVITCVSAGEGFTVFGTKTQCIITGEIDKVTDKPFLVFDLNCAIGQISCGPDNVILLEKKETELFTAYTTSFYDIIIQTTSDENGIIPKKRTRETSQKKRKRRKFSSAKLKYGFTGICCMNGSCGHTTQW